MSTTLSHRGPRQLLRPFHALREEFDQMLKGMPFDWESKWLTSEFSPACDLSETADAYQVRLDVPGIKPDDISVTVTGDSVRISGERKEEKEEKDKTFHRVERRCGSFCEAMRLPGAVNEEKVLAEFHDGVLTVTLPKSEATRTRTVKVKTGNPK
ncbi:MAG: Hsp20/alpha crystallin family protein [Planctomycetaceae bacterium]